MYTSIIDRMSELVVIRFRGRMYHVPKGIMETDEQSGDRAWYIAKRQPATKQEFVRVKDESHKWCNEKYLRMKYTQTSEDA